RSLAAAAGGVLGVDAAEWVLEHANGNPLALVELPHALSAGQRDGREPLHGAIPPTTTVEQTYLQQLRCLPPETGALLVVAAAEETGDRATIAGAAAELGLQRDALVPAEQGGLVRVGPDRVEFRHPLVRSAVYRGAGFAERERAHRALAATLSAPV